MKKPVKSKKNIIYIDSSGIGKISVGLYIAKLDINESLVFKTKSDQILENIIKLTKKHNIDLTQVEAIHVSTGPGSYTGIRVGIAIAKALSLLLGIPVKNMNGGDSLDPIYENDRYK
ncbi:hypothetical protein ACFL1A_01415 [Patescibacteria group bacterium]